MPTGGLHARPPGIELSQQFHPQIRHLLGLQKRFKRETHGL
jgi:hypothetical protein